MSHEEGGLLFGIDASVNEVSDTPITDAAQFYISTSPAMSPDEGEMVVNHTVARNLERENNQLREEIKQLNFDARSLAGKVRKDHKIGGTIPSLQIERDKWKKCAKSLYESMILIRDELPVIIRNECSTSECAQKAIEMFEQSINEEMK